MLHYRYFISDILVVSPPMRMMIAFVDARCIRQLKTAPAMGAHGVRQRQSANDVSRRYPFGSLGDILGERQVGVKRFVSFH
jgi:hypothetical protein